MSESFPEQYSPTRWRWLFLCAVAAGILTCLFLRGRAGESGDELTRLQRMARSADAVYFYQASCRDCAKALPRVRRFAKRRRHLVLARIESSSMAAIQIREQFDLSYRVAAKQRQKVPAFFAGGHALVGLEDIQTHLDQLSVANNPPGGLVSASLAARSLVTRFKHMGLFSVLVAGLVDSINPCAIAVLLFLISYLAATGSSQDIMRIGLTFIVGVFIAYFIVGLGLLKVVMAAAKLRWFARVLYPAFALMTGAFAVLSFADFVSYRRNQREARLGLSRDTHVRIHGVIRKHLKRNTLAWGALIVGFTVSLLELACTGQVYLPTIIYVSSLPGQGLRAISFLFVYNLAFVVPLALILISTRIGVQSQSLIHAARRYTATSKLCLALLFLAMFAYMLSISTTVWGLSGR